MSACALLLVANKDRALVPALREYESLLEAKRLRRGLRPGDDVIDAAAADVRDMIEEPVKWAHRWLREFATIRTIRPGLYSSQITACDSSVVRKPRSSWFQPHSRTRGREGITMSNDEYREFEEALTDVLTETA
jgi:hypothetical protein